MSRFYLLARLGIVFLLIKVNDYEPNPSYQIRDLSGSEGGNKPHVIAEIRDSKGNPKQGSYLEIVPK
jgi:hypothetical protein